ncbi:MAG: hypothetical protein HY517_01020 [Candidatus Aenigmarchaeota archaeon]|nr:hypothetical protein [Candidatus Aenigmarchaeota archaeon]
MRVDHTVIETVDGCYFMIVGNIHPPGRYVGLLTYVPSEPWHSRNDISRKMIGGREYTKISRAWFGHKDEYARHLT